ncbi:MAG: hypothetical protein IKI42_01555, partial [Clostridia bacterium]|nr:hypothetical protein [Clostridia bacterium]
MLASIMVLSLIPAIQLSVSAAAVDTGVTGLTADSSGNATWTASGGTITGSVTASSSTGCGSTSYSSRNGTLTFTNSSESVALLSFDYSLTLSGGSATVDGATVTAGASFSKKLEAGDTVAVKITSNNSNSEATTITISNIKLTEEKDVNITFKAPSNGTYTVDGEAITADTIKTVKTTDTVSLAATPASGYKFFGWYSETSGSYFATTASLSTSFTEDQTVVPEFVPGTTPVFKVGSKLFTDLNEAAQANGSLIVLMSNATLPGGDYTIPSGKTLLIPMDAAETVYRDAPSIVYNSYATPTAYRILTMASGASITVESGGAICLPSKLSSKGQLAGWNGTPTGPDGRINMQSGSTITVKNGGNLYAWGYIYGSGSVVAESGATVHEAFQIKDWRGGSATSNIYSYAFILSQYYVQNIEVPLTIYSGATEKLYSAVNASSSAYTMGATFVGNGGLFKINTGYIVKDYIESTDRLQVDCYGDVSISSMNMTGLPIIGSINTSGYILPINSNVTINLHSGTSTIDQNLELLPSTEVTVDEGATLNVASGKKVYVYDNDNWGNFTGSARLYVIGYSVANGTTAKRTAAGLVNAKVDVNGTVNVSGNIYTSQGGANITSSQGTGKIVYNTAPGTSDSTIYEMANNSTKTPVTFNPARLKNADGTYVETAGKPAGTTIPYIDGFWGGVPAPTYTVNWWLDAEADEPLYTAEVEEGETPVYNGTTPTKDSTAQYDYTFDGWTKEGDDTVYTDLPAASADVSYYAHFAEAVRSYNVTWVVGEYNISSMWEYGDTPYYLNGEPTKEPDAQYTYTFTGWYPDIVPVEDEAIYTAQFSQTLNKYFVTWIVDGTPTDEEYNYGETPVYKVNGEPATPIKEGDAQFSYTFTGWSPELSSVSGPATYTAQFSETLNTYTVTWNNWDGSELEKDEDVAYGTTPSYDGETPTKEGDAQFSYTFAGWTPAVTSDSIVTG